MIAAGPVEVDGTDNHSPSHRKLITVDAVARPAPVDAIIVPTARPVAYLRTAMALARDRGCVLVALCSKLAAANVAFREAKASGTEIIAVDVTAGLSTRMPRFDTSDVTASTAFERRTDTSMKRNLGLLLAQVAGWERIVFLDDDISVPRAADLNDAAGLLDYYTGAGLAIGGFPDNSVVCHAFRDAGGKQDTFIGGGALAIGQRSYSSFFPDIYNEDWFFLLEEKTLSPSASTGKVVQAAYDPYRDDRRARSEELGDSLAEGLFWLLDNGRELTDADESGYWVDFLGRRRQFIDEVIEMVRDAQHLGSADKSRMTAALKAAKGRNLKIQPDMCVDYLAAWRKDRERWQGYLSSMNATYHDRGVPRLLNFLGLRTFRTRQAI
ncbi:hypothetical protein DMH04_02690 [Kibdelosporangium aridum]|uniref:Uncharacterized protein n=1 Tax=Kibdelosporangium aridum TaxID=2030 RepID=A0A428ZQS1_KIBAR|nr:hypothetical protein [Kibdelosporangium aridum]RSM90400.1 hypothetical protein DMH04_02690 [Kibdelosporangium aridum]